VSPAETARTVRLRLAAELADDRLSVFGSRQYDVHMSTIGRSPLEKMTENGSRAMGVTWRRGGVWVDAVGPRPARAPVDGGHRVHRELRLRPRLQFAVRLGSLLGP